MSRWLCLFVLLCCGSRAALASPTDDDMGRFLADKGLLDRLELVRSRVTDKASELVFNAMGFLGVPYRRGGNSAETGFDCSGFVRAMYQQTIGLVLPRRANEQAAATQAIDRKDLKPGDLVFFNTMRQAFSHVGIYVGENKFIHSPRPGAQVRVEDMRLAYWSHRFAGPTLIARTLGRGLRTASTRAASPAPPIRCPVQPGSAGAMRAAPA
jgi:cell wall-associated NlpC family hydrolase